MMIDPTKLTMGLTVEELEKLEELRQHNQFCEDLSAPRAGSTTSQNKTWSCEAPTASRRKLETKKEAPALENRQGNWTSSANEAT